jgi:ubiquinone/menaquinone biosynthesis C-methylase UbiE
MRKKFFYLAFFTILIATTGFCSSHYRAEMFNRLATLPESKPDEIIKSLKITEGMRIADLGAGGGYFTFRFASLTGKRGHVYAVDIDENFLKFIKERAKAARVNNITTVKADADNPRLDGLSLDLLFIRNVFHHLPDRIKYFRKLRSALDTNARVAIIEYHGRGSFGVHGHSTPPEKILRIMKRAGYTLVKKYTFLTEESFHIFKVL